MVKKINNKTSDHLLKERFLEMIHQNYECIGLYDKKTLIGICGLWFQTRHYVGKSVELDHVVIDGNYRNKGLGTYFLNWVYTYCKEKGYEATELNTYTGNTKSHKFYYNEGYDIYGFHMVKILRDNKEFY